MYRALSIGTSKVLKERPAAQNEGYTGCCFAYLGGPGKTGPELSEGFFSLGLADGPIPTFRLQSIDMCGKTYSWKDSLLNHHKPGPSNST